MWISKKEYASMQKKIADLEKQVEYQQLTIEMCKKVDTAALEVRANWERKSIGVTIPNDCKQIYVFDTAEEFLKQLASGKMIPLYGKQEHEKMFFPIFIAYMPTVNH